MKPFDRFKVCVSAPDQNGCYLWTGGVGGNGYGNFCLGTRSAGGISAHRFAYILANGPIPQGTMVLHTCDVKLCVNPAHLFLGDGSDNMRDMTEKGRGFMKRGAGHPLAKLTDEKVRWMRSEREKGRSNAEIAKDLGVSSVLVWGVTTRRTWRHVD